MQETAVYICIMRALLGSSH